MNKFELAVAETQSVLDEWMTDTAVYPALHTAMAKAVVERLIAKGVIQSTVLNDLLDFRGPYRTGPLEPGQTIVP